MDFVPYKLSDDSILEIFEIDTGNNDEKTPCDEAFVQSFIDYTKIEYDTMITNQEMNITNANTEFLEMNDYAISEQSSKDVDLNNKVEPNVNLDISQNNDKDLEKEESVCKFEDIITEWNTLKTISQRQKFIIDLSTSSDSILSFSYNILLPWLNSDETITEAVDTLAGVIANLPEQSINVIFSSLFREKQCALFTENQGIEHLIKSMSDAQKNHLTCCILYEIGDETRDNEINMFCNIINTTQLNVNTIQILLQHIVKQVYHIKNDKHFGNLLLLLSQQLTANTPLEIIQQIEYLCDHFKGVMRFRIKTILKEIKQN